jgi:hypothetical protein
LVSEVGCGTDLGVITPLMEVLRDWAATAPRRSPDDGDPSETVEAVKTRLQYLFDSLVIDPQGDTFTATWAPDVAVLLGQQETIVPCKARRARAAQQPGADRGSPTPA